MDTIKLYYLVLCVVFTSGCASVPEPILVYCDDGKGPVPRFSLPILVYSDPSMAYKDVASNYEFNLEGLKAVLKKYHVQHGFGELTVNNKVKELQEKLNQKNIFHKNTLKAIALSYQQNPCDIEANKRLFSYLEKLNDNALELDKIWIDLKSSLSSGDSSRGESIIDEANKKPIVDEPGTVATKCITFPRAK